VRQRVTPVLMRILSWGVGNSLAGAVIGVAVGFFTGRGVEAPTVVISVLFGNVVGFTAMVSSIWLFPRLRGLAPPLRLLLFGLALLTGSLAGSAAVLQAYPLFVFSDPFQALAIVLINGILALTVGSVVYGYEGMRLRMQDSLREVEQVRLVEARLREEAARAELAALQARINPHFFFNTLNTISSFLDEDTAQAEEVLQTLSDMFRYTFMAADCGPVRLDAELDFTRSYVTIEQARFGARLQVEWAIEPAAAAIRVPGLIVQPLVENAVGHGIAPRASGGKVLVAARVEEQLLRIEITDDGVGLQDNGRSLIRDGHGLHNVRTRIETYYPGRGSLDLRPGPDGRGTLVSICIPVQTDRP
jgi:sensor histidine kinase YesM